MIDALAPDGVYAIGPPHLLYDAWLWCLQRGVNLFIEKPMGLTLHHARMLAHLAEERGVMTQVGHQRRASPLLVKLREECLRRGPITHAVCEFYKCDQRPFIDARDRMLDDCVHSIDTLRWMCGGEVVDVDSRCRRVGVPDVLRLRRLRGEVARVHRLAENRHRGHRLTIPGRAVKTMEVAEKILAKAVLAGH